MIKSGYAAISDVAVHSVTLETEEGFQLDRKCYKHDPAPQSEY